MKLHEPEAGRFYHYTSDSADENSVNSNYIRSLFVDHLGVLWVGTSSEGLNRYAGGDGFERFVYDPQNPSSISRNNILSFFEDSEHVLWIGTARGLNRLDRKTMQFTRYFSSDSDPNSLSNDYINCIYEDSVGILWVGTNEGVNRFNREDDSFSYLSVQHGLASNYVYGILEDDEKNLWIKFFQVPQGFYCQP